VTAWILTAAALWALLALAAARIAALSTRGDIESGLALLVMRLYAAVFHGLRVSGRVHIPPKDHEGPLIVVSNHTAGVDPILIQAACGFEITWIMAEDMRLPWLEEFWSWGGIIFVDRHNPSTAPVRRATSHLRSGGVLGLFPEARIERPPRTLLPFHAGVGAFVKQTGARVLPVIIEGTPTRARSAWTSLLLPSRARLRVMPPIDYTKERISPARIADDLESRYAEWTGWPVAAHTPGYPHERGAAARRRARAETG